MSKILYCKDKAVYNIDTEEVYNNNLLPGFMLVHGANRYSFKAWLKLRYSSNTNTLARQLKGIAFGQGNRVTINKETRALSLSDCYWIKDKTDTITFRQVSPYYADFWTGKGEYISGKSVPTLYVGGYLGKEWVNSRTLIKYGEETTIEYEATSICKLCNIESVNIKQIDNGIAIENMTNTSLMLEQADQSGRIDPDDFNECTIEKIFGIDGVKMLIIDAILANGDRHAGNFGWLRNTDTGEYVKMAPLYDFDHALDSTLESDRLLTDAVKIIKTQPRYIDEAIRICRIILRIPNIHALFKLRVNKMISYINIKH